MKIQTAIVLVSALFLSSCNFKSEGNGTFSVFPKQGKGPIKTKEFIMDFDQIKVSQSISAEVIKSSTEKVVISAPEDLMDDVMVENSAGKLHIHFKPGININSSKVSAKIYAKDFDELEANSSADIVVKDQFTQDKTSVKVSSSGDISGDLEANDLSIEASSSGSFTGKVWAVNLEADASSSGTVTLSGKAKNADMDASSSGDIVARDVIVQNADLEASSSGSISLSVSDVLEASANSSGDINVTKKGNLSVQQSKESSGGSIMIH